MLCRTAVYLVQHRQHLVAKPVSAVKVKPVCRIFAIRLPKRRKIRFDLTSVNPKKRADQIPVHRSDCRKPPDARPPRQMKQHRLRPVVAVMGDRDPATFS